MTATLKSLQWMTIQEVADMWQPHLKIEKTAILRELQLGWYKWSREKAGVEGFACGTPLKGLPPRAEWPATDELIDREYLEQFAIKQGWPLPGDWFKGRASDSDRAPGRPSNKRAIVHRLRKVAESGGLRGTLSAQAADLHDWADKEFPAEQIPTKRVIENQIRDVYRELKTKTRPTE